MSAPELSAETSSGPSARRIPTRSETGTSPQRLKGPVVQPCLVMQLKGAQVEMGRQYGELLKQFGGWEAILDFYPEMAEHMLFSRRQGVEDALRLLSRPVFDYLIRRLDAGRIPEFRARNVASLVAAGRPKENARFISVVDLFQNLVGMAGKAGLGPFGRRFAVPACTSVMAWGADTHDGDMLHARNFDFPGIGIWDAAPNVVFCEPDAGVKYGYITTRGADVPGVTCFNEAGLVLTAHTRFSKDVTFTGLGIVDLGHDIIRRAETLDDAVAIAKERRVASTWGLAISSATERSAISIEISAAGVNVVETGDQDTMTCANCYRTDLRSREIMGSPTWAAHSNGRERRAQQLVDEARARGGATADDLMRLLGDHRDAEDLSVERGCGSVISQPATVKSVVFEPDKARMHVSVGPAPTGRGPYLPISWEWTGSVGATEVVLSPQKMAERNSNYDQNDGKGRGYALFLEASRVEGIEHDHTRVMTLLERARGADPDDPSYAFLAGMLALQHNRVDDALRHFDEGLRFENAPYRRGLMLLWTSRAAQALGHKDRAREARMELLGLDNDLLKEAQSLAKVEHRRAYPRRKFKGLNLSTLFVDVI